MTFDHGTEAAAAALEHNVAGPQGQVGLLDLAHDAILVRGFSDSTIRYWNRGAEELYGWGREETVGRVSHTLLETGFPRPLEEIQVELARVGRWEGELAHTRRDGKRLVVASRWALQRDEWGRPIATLEINTDITDRRQAEEVRARLAAIVESSEDAIIGKTLEGTITRWNPGAERLYGYAPEEVVGQQISLLIPPDRPDELPGILARLRRGERIDHYETERVTKDGRRVHVSLSISPIRAGDDRLVGAATIARDITERIRAEAERVRLEWQLAGYAAQLEAANQELEAFSYSVSHDLRAPLRSIDGFSQALLEDYGDRPDEPGRGYLGRVRAAAQRMAELIDDLLHLARVTRAELRPEVVDLSALAEAAADQLQKSAPGRAVELVIRPGIRGRGDRRLLQIALENLLGNAWKFTAGRDPARIEFGITEADGQPAYFVRDNGVGFDMAYAGKLFGAFQRLHGAQEFEGTGIGLATVQRIVHRHGGRVWAEAAVDRGATFYFTL